MLSGGELLFHTIEGNARNNQEFLTIQITGLYLKLDGGRFVARPTHIIMVTQTKIESVILGSYGIKRITGSTVKHTNNKHIIIN
jgi:hypothetical protein